MKRASLPYGLAHSLMAYVFVSAVMLSLGALMSPAFAQTANVCEQGRKLLQQRQAIIGQINSWSKKKVDPNTACAAFTRLQGNGSATLKWMETNKDWCQIPEDAMTGLSNAQGQIGKNRANACQVAVQFNKAKKQAIQQAQQQRAKQQQQQQGAAGGAFGGADQITGGAIPVPSGSL
jgi:hypothetical protein